VLLLYIKYYLILTVLIEFLYILISFARAAADEDRLNPGRCSHIKLDKSKMNAESVLSQVHHA